jgi:hypothetical protein
VRCCDAASGCRFIEISRDFEKRRKTLQDLSRQTSANQGDDFVPASAASSFRTAAKTLRSAIAMRSGRISPSRGVLDEAAAGAEAVEGADSRPELPELPEIGESEMSSITDEELFSTMQGQWVEVECLLRVQLRTSEALDDAGSRVRASLAFDKTLNERAASSGVLKGAIFQALLAFVDGNADSTADSVGLEVTAEQWDELGRGSDALRKLVRIKVQDDNDLKAANLALASCAEFFDNLQRYATRKELDRTTVLSHLEESF